MPTFISMLRGINVGGHKRVKMDRLKALYEGLGFREVRTYIQSGNVVFRSATRSAARLAERIQESIAAEFGFEVTVILRTPGELEKVLRENPFRTAAEAKGSRVHVVFLSETPARRAVRELEEEETGRQELRVAGREIYLHTPDGYVPTKLDTNFLERALSVQATARNWNSVKKLHEMARGGAVGKDARER